MRPPDDLHWVAMTIKMEAEGEAYIGKLAVAFVIVNRMRAERTSASDVVLRAFQLSCWNTSSPTRMRLDDYETNRAVWIDAYKAAAAALLELADDPTHGATSYLNPKTTTPEQRARAGYRSDRVRFQTDGHDFFIAA